MTLSITLYKSTEIKREIRAFLMKNNFNFPPKPNGIARAFVITILVTLLIMTFHFVTRAMIYELIQ